jgi:putative hydrolase of the HAD superfamily
MSDAPAAIPDRLDAVLFDAGGVLVDLDYSYLRRLIGPVVGEVEESALSHAEAHARREINNTVRGGGRTSDAWREYFHIILGRVGVREERHGALIDTLQEAHERFGLWSVACHGAVEAVRAIKAQGFRVGVVSNAEGQIEGSLGHAGFGGLFETVVDSHLVGVEKPNPEIFRVALKRMSLRAESTLYIGDLPEVDVKGARSAGLSAVLLDRHDLYLDEAMPRVRHLQDLLALLPAKGSAQN